MLMQQFRPLTRLFPPGPVHPAPKRARCIQAVADGLARREQELAATITAEMGMPLELCLPVQVQGPAEGMASYVERAALMEQVDHKDKVTIHREAIGVCALITPWNYPLHQIVGKCAPALAAGCTMVLKPSEITPLSAIMFAEVIDEVGLPPGVFNLIQGTGTPIGEALVALSNENMMLKRG